MEYKLLIAEKPSVARQIAQVLKINRQKNGYLEGQGYLITWCLGHLAELASPEDYDEQYAKWKREDLPVVPRHWKYIVSEATKKQYQIVKELMQRKDVICIIEATDAGREGEHIFRTIYQLIGCQKPVQRLWISSMEDEAIQKGLDALKPGSDYDNLAAAAECRARADWLVGINATRLFSVLYHRTLKVGRVMSPTLAMIVQREAEIQAFHPDTFFTASLNVPGFQAVSGRFTQKEEAEALCRRCEGQSAVVQSVRQKEKQEKAPALYDLTTLQRDANRLLGFTAQQTLDYTQSLYEKRLCTYPRTDIRFLTDDMGETANETVRIAAALLGNPLPEGFSPEQVLNSRKVTDHHAIIPTRSAGGVDLKTLPAGEAEILKLLARRMMISVASPYQYVETTIQLSCADRTFTAKGRQIQNRGWRTYEKQENTDLELSALKKEERLPVLSVNLREGHTTAPGHYTEDTLLKALETAGNMPEDTERKGLGTPATRAGIVEKLISTGLVERVKNRKTTNLIPTSTGMALVTVLPEQLQSPLLTAEWETRLKKIEQGEEAPERFMQEIESMITDLVHTYAPAEGTDVLFPSDRPVVGRCPRCGGPVTEKKPGFFCEGSGCRFGVWRDNRFLIRKRIKLDNKMLSTLLRDGKVFVSGIYSERTGKHFDAYLLLEDDGTRVSFGFAFQREVRA